MGGSAHLTLEFTPGEHVSRCAELLVEAAKQAGREAAGSFNGIAMWASPRSDPADVLSNWERERDAETAAYRASPEGRAVARERQAERDRLQREGDALVASLDALDWADDAAVLGWLCRLQPVSDHVGVSLNRNSIAEAFTARGYEPGANVGSDYRAEDRENSFRYLVGQALDGLLHGPAIHPMLLHFADAWRLRFGAGER